MNNDDCMVIFDQDIVPHECIKGANHSEPHVCGICGVRWVGNAIVGYQDELN